MRIRWKFLIVLLSISLIPMIMMRLNGQQAIRELGNDLATQTKNALITETKVALKRLVEDHARILKRERELLEMTLLLVSSEIQKRLYNLHDYSHLEAGPFFPTQTIPLHEHYDKEMYCLLKPHGQCLPLQMNFMNQRFYINSLSDPDNDEILDIIHRLTSMSPLNLAMKNKHPELIMWQYIFLENGLRMIYPDPGLSSVRRLHQDIFPPDWYHPTKEKNRINWSQPSLDNITRNIVFFVSAPLHDPKGNFIGATAIAVPLTVFLHENEHIRLLSDHVISLLIKAEASSEGPLSIIAQESTYVKKHMPWFAADSPMQLESPDKKQLLEISEDLKSHRSNVREIIYNGSLNLVAYQSFDEHGTALLLIVPQEDILRDALLMEQSVHDQIHEQIVFTGIILLSIIILIIGVSFILSRSFTINISKLAEAAGRVASGDFQARVQLKSHDELGELGNTFNKMIPALEERVFMKQSLDFAAEVQQSLFPSKIPYVEGMDIAAKSLYCHETGGDFYDFIDVQRGDITHTGIAVGDVTGHGLPAALLMATSRAFLISRLTQPGTMGQIMTDINRLLAKDTEKTSQFVTLFYLEIEHEEKNVRWIKAGHDPAIVYDSSSDKFSKLDGPGPALGIINDFQFQDTAELKYRSGQILLIGTDGIWETRNPQGKMFKKERIKELIKKHRSDSAKQILDAIINALSNFRGIQPQDDDVTLVVIKIK
jgi:phosphoserine phosphatase RsbU/P